jgi:uroporphyrinogen-III synthase
VGARPLVFPALAIEDLAWSDRIERSIAHLAQASWAIFVSANAVDKGLAAAQRAGAWPVQARVAAVGEATAQALHAGGFRDVLAPRERHDSEALLELPQLRHVAGERVMIFRGQGGRERLK